MRAELRFIPAAGCWGSVRRALLLGVCGLCLTPATLMAAGLTVRGGVHPDFDRLVFEWPKATPYKVERQGDQITLQFKGSSDINFAPFTSAKVNRAHDFALVQNTDEGLLIRFTVAANSVVKDFQSGTAIVVDISAGAPAGNTAEKPQKAVAQEAAEKAVVPAKAEKAEKKNPTPSAPIENPALSAHPTASALSAISASPASASPAHPASSAVVEEPKSSSALAPSHPREGGDPVPPSPQPPVTAPISAPEAAPSPSHAAPPVEAKAPPPAAASPRLTLPEMTGTPLQVLALDPGTAVGTAICVRGGYAYILFDRKLGLDLKALTFRLAPPMVPLEAIDLPLNNGFRFPIPSDAELSTVREGTVWRFMLSRQNTMATAGRVLLPQPNFALGARLLLQIANPPEPIRFNDPVVGDEIIVLPLRQTEPFAASHRYAEFETLSCAQGLVVRPLIDKLIVRKVSDGVEITKAGGLLLSPSTDTGVTDVSLPQGVAAVKTIFDLTSWRGKPDETFTLTEQRLLRSIIEVPDNERNRARLDFARFFFAHNMGEETLGILKYLLSKDPDLKGYPEFVALSGAAKIEAGRIAEGYADLTQADLQNQTESVLWQAVAQTQLRQWQDAEDKFIQAKNLLTNYPDPFYSKFVVLAVETALAVGKDREAADWLTAIDSKEHLASVAPALNYLHAVIHSKAGRQEVAEQLWKQTSAGPDRLYKVRADLALIDLGVATGSLTPAQAADRLEVLRYAWRGDDLELEILHRLGLFYLDARNLRAGMNVLAQATRLFPNNPMAPQIRSEMAVAFRNAFTDDSKRAIPPLEALSLYQTYGDLMPTGDERVKVIRTLAEKLVAIDLLDQACDLLEGLIKNALQGVEKAQTGTRLAAIRLLDHKAEAALAALAYGPAENLPADLTAQRTLMRARALSELDRPDEALTLLQNMTSLPAKFLRANINMHSKRWAEAAKVLLEIIGPPPKDGSALSSDQSRLLVNCAVAMALGGDTTGLDRLAIDYGPFLANMPQNDVFRVLTRPEKATSTRDLAAAQAKLGEVDLFRGFLDAYRGEPKKGAK